MAFYFLVEVTDAISSSNLFTCHAKLLEWLYDIADIKLIYTDFEKWRKREKDWNNFKPIVFAHVEFLELIHPTS